MLPAILLLHSGEDLKALTDGIETIEVHGSPGPVVTFTPDAFPVFIGDSGGQRAALAAASRLGRGRILAFGHTGYLDGPKGNGIRLLENGLTWLAGTRDLSRIRVGVHGIRGLERFLKARKVSVVTADLSRLESIDVLVMSAFALRTDEQEKAVSAFVRKGGGLMTGATGWAYTTYIEKGKDLVLDFRGNRLLRPAGIAFTTDTIKPPTPAGFPRAPAPSGAIHAGTALDLLEGAISGKARPDKQELPQITATLTLAIRSVPTGGTPFAERLAKILLRPGAGALPDPKRPIRNTDLPAWMAATCSTLRARTLPVDKLTPHPGAGAFPGSVPAGSTRTKRTVRVDTSIPRWNSTGLYAAPGEIVAATLPESAVNAGIQIRVGAHRDGLWRKTSWRRCPEITRTFPVTAARTRVACAFGGPIYVDVPRACKAGTVSVVFANAVPAPLFMLGKTSLEEWRQTQRKHPAPWAEIGSSKFILTVPSDLVRTLDDPKTLMETWDQALDLIADLARIPRDRPSPERIVFDAQISAGFMHSGYPIMAHVPQAGEALKVDVIRDPHKAWGFLHELGHNHQHRDWTFSGTGEVTCNLFVLYVGEKLGGIPPARVKRTDRNARDKLLKRHYAKGASFETWKSQPFLALAMYAQMLEEFGWQPFLDVFDEYRKLGQREHPRNDEDRRDQWMVRFSRRVGRDLGPFFEAWGVPVSAEARRSIASLPDWLPDEMKPYATKKGR